MPALAGAPMMAQDRPAVFNSPLNAFEIQTGKSGESFDLSFQYPFARTGFAHVMPVAGDWDGDGLDSIGAFEFIGDRFHLRNVNLPGPDDHEIGFERGQLQPVAGDWNGDGVDTTGVFRASDSLFRLRNANSSGPPDLEFSFGPANTVPIAGDWDGDGTDTIGVYAPQSAEFRLRNVNSSGPPDLIFSFGPANALPVSGDWNGDGVDTIGVLDPITNRLLLRNANTPGEPDAIVPLREIRDGWMPIAGRWHVPDPYPPQPGFPWEQSDPERENIDASQLAAAYARAGQNAALNALLVVRHDKLVAEEYFAGYHAGLAGNLKSVSKSILSALVGIALRDAHFDDLDQTVAAILPEYFSGPVDPRKLRIAIRHLVTMTSGLWWDESNGTTAWFFSGDLHRYVLERPMLGEPGTRFLYSTGLSHLMSCMLERASGRDAPAFAQTHLVEPLGISVQRWDYDPQRHPIGGSEVYLTPRDMARFGNLYLRRGTIDGESIIPADWVDWSTDERVPPAWVPGGYGYGAWWWRRSFGDHPAYFAWGYGGQFIFVIPSLDLVVVATSKWNVTGSQSSQQASAIFALLEQWILPAVRPDPEIATLTAMRVRSGTLLEGGLQDLEASEDSYVRLRSEFTFRVNEPNLVVLEITAEGEGSAQTLDASLESRINNPGGTATLRMRNWVTNRYETVHTFATSQHDEVESVESLDAGRYVRGDGRIQTRLKTVVLATFEVSGFESFVDHFVIRLYD